MVPQQQPPPYYAPMQPAPYMQPATGGGYGGAALLASANPFAALQPRPIGSAAQMTPQQQWQLQQQQQQQQQHPNTWRRQ